MRDKKRLTWICCSLAIAYLLFDIGFSFAQYAAEPLDGDMVAISMPMEHYRKVLEDPFGFNLLKDPTPYAATNRYFSHQAMHLWFNDVYQFLAPCFGSRIDALYFTSALFSVSIHVLMLVLLSLYVVSAVRGTWKTFLVSCVVITTLFQFRHGFYDQIGVIDHAITYTFFYAFPMSLLFLFFWPFFRRIQQQQPLRWYEHLLCLILLPVLPFCGAINAAVILMVCPLSAGLAVFYWRWQISNTFRWTLLGYFFLLSVWALYSFYIGRFNAESLAEIPLSERYVYLFKGIPEFLTVSYAFWLIGGVLLVNYLLIRERYPFVSKILMLLTAFMAMYILALPFGGYRVYRPWVVRYDVILPVTFILIFCFTAGTILAIRALDHRKALKPYLFFMLTILIVFAVKDRNKLDRNICQKEALQKIAGAGDEVVVIPEHCTVLSWFSIKDPDGLAHVSRMLVQWGITEKEVPFHNE